MTSSWPATPAIVVGDHGGGGVADLGFASELGFLEVGHADDVGAPAAVEVRLGAGGELRAFHADVGAFVDGGDAGGFAGGEKDEGDGGADGIAKGNVADDAFAKESGGAQEGAVDELVGDDEVSGPVLFFERADGGERKDARDAEFFEGVEVGAEIEFGGQDTMTASVTGEEGDFAAL